MFSGLRGLHQTLVARTVRYFRAKEVIKVLAPLHAKELAETPVNQWVQKKSEQAKEIAAVKSGSFSIIDRRSWCYSADTEVLTKRGWVKWPEITGKDIFASRTSDGVLEYISAKRLLKFVYKGKLLHFKNNGADLLVTPNHRLLGRKCTSGQNTVHPVFSEEDFFLAKDIAKLRRNDPRVDTCLFRVPVTSEWYGKRPASNYVVTASPEKGGRPKAYCFKAEDWISFLGIYVGAGSIIGAQKGLIKDYSCPTPLFVQSMAASVDPKYQNIVSYDVVISEASPFVRKRVKKLLARMGLPSNERASGGLRFTSKAIHEALQNIGDSYSRCVPEFIKDLEPKYLSLFLDNLSLVSGWRGKNGKRAFKTTSLKLAGDLQELLQKVGSGAVFIKDRNPNRNLPRVTAPIYVVKELVRKEIGIELRGQVPYNGFVYCAETKNGTLLVRRNGKIAWSGNSYPYIPEALHRLNQPILKNSPYNLRRFAETPIPRRAINMIKNSLLALRWRVSIDEENYDDDDPELLKKVKIAEDCLKRPNLQDSYRTLFEAVIEDFLMGGYGTIEPQLTPDYRRPIKLWSVDGSTIRIYADWTESTPDRPHYAQLTGLKGERGIISFLDDELIYIRDNVRSSTPFGIGKMETCFLSINALLGAQDMSARAAADQIHKTWLWWTTNLPPGQFETIQRHIQNEAEGQAKVSLSTGMPKPEVIEVNPVTPEDLLMEWQTLLIRIIAAGFDLSPMSLGLERDVNRSTAAVMSEQDFNSAIVPAARKFEEAITRLILHRTLGWKELKFEYIGLDDPDEIIQAQLMGRLYPLNAITPDEIRDKMQIGPPLQGGWGKLTSGQMQLIIQAAVGKGGGSGAGSMGAGGGMGGGGGIGTGLPSGYSSGGMGAGRDPEYRKRTPQIVASLDDSPFSAEDLAQMDPQELEQFRQAGVIPYDPKDLQDQMEAQSPGILQTLSEELQEYFEWLEQEEEENEKKPAKVSSKDEKEQQKKFDERQRRVDEVEKAQRTSEKFRTGYETRNYRGPFPKKSVMPKGLGKKRKTPPNFTGRTR